MDASHSNEHYQVKYDFYKKDTKNNATSASIITLLVNYHPGWEPMLTSRPWLLDVSVIHPTSTRTHQNLSPAAGSTRIRERGKENKYGNMCPQMEKKLAPFVFQSYGGIGEHGLTSLSELRNRPASLHVYQPVRFVDSV